jgi:hypothetical protein
MDDIEQTMDEISCPECGHRFRLTDSLQKRFRDQALREAEMILEQERSKVAETAKKEIQAELGERVRELTAQLDEKEKKLSETRKAESELRKHARELEDREKNVELEVQRKIDEEKVRVEEATATRVLEQYRLKDKEKERTINELQSSLEDMKRKVEQGSQQAQGEIQELDLEERLKAIFPWDTIEPVTKGIRGADVIQRVRDNMNRECGSVIWESKRTKSWSDGWLQKLKDDQRSATADIAVLVSQVLPKDIGNFGEQDGVWVTDYLSFIGLAAALREQLINVAQVKRASVGKDQKMEMLYTYLTGAEFRQRVQAIIETFAALQEDLDQEKRAFEKRWKKREKLITRVVDNTSGMYGDLQGLIGAPLKDIHALELDMSDDQMLESPGKEERA